MEWRGQTHRYFVLIVFLSMAFACNTPEPASVPGGGNSRAQPAPEPDQRTLTVSPESGPPGSEVHLTGSGYDPNAMIRIGVGPVQSEFEIIGQARTDAQGQLHTTATVPNWTADDLRIVFVATQEQAPWRVISNEFAVLNDSTGQTARERIIIRGTLTDEGVECQALRGEDGQLYTLTGDLNGLETGARVQVVGTVAEISFCMQGTTISVSEIERL